MSPIASLLRVLILGYKYLLSPVLPMACRYQPSCSSYALEAVQRFGGWHGGWLAVRRIGRCHPWGGSGFDPVPEHESACCSDARGGHTLHPSNR